MNKKNELLETISTAIPDSITANASSSLFGWNFQIEAGLFLAAYYGDSFERLIMESKYQDVELHLFGDKAIYAQAKSMVDYTVNTHETGREKLQNALASLAVTQAVCSKSINEDTYLYISNIPNYFPNTEKIFTDKVRLYGDFPKDVQDQIDSLLESTSRLFAERASKEKNKRRHGKYMFLSKALREFDRTRFAICELPGYLKESELVRAKEFVTDFLTDCLGIPGESLGNLPKRLAEHYRSECLEKGARLPDHFEKEIGRERFLWPVILFKIDERWGNGDIAKYVDSYDGTKVAEAQNRLQSLADKEPQFIAFEKTNDILSRFREFKKSRFSLKGDLVVSFIRDNWREYTKSFEGISGGDEEIMQYIAVLYMDSVLASQRVIEQVLNHKEAR